MRGNNYYDRQRITQADRDASARMRRQRQRHTAAILASESAREEAAKAGKPYDQQMEAASAAYAASMAASE